MAKNIIPIRKPWKGELTHRERFNRQMSCQPVDRSFNMEFGYWGENYTQWDIFLKNGITGEEEANKFFAFDPIVTIYGKIWMEPAFPYKNLGQRGNKNIIQNEDGLMAEIAADNHSTIPHFTKSPIETPDDWNRIKKERFQINNPARKMDTEKIIQAHPTNRDYPLGIDCGSMIGKIRDLLTFEGICYTWADYPEMLEDMVETCCVLVENMLDQVLGRVDFDFASGWEDICFNYGPILPPSFFEEIVAPRYKRISKKLTDHGINLWYTDCDGDVRPILKIFLESGINCLFPYEVNSCTHPGELLDQYENLRIMGGVDKMKLIAGRKEIKEYLESLVPYVQRGGFIPFCDHRCPPDVTPDNYLYYLDVKEALFGGK